ncbi:hypothetical protein PX52LOC_01991 [Limnoglobus roseus]|uniref:Uncharacterized protein n=1 Tax=Limnoglobus roseus TaxID=2598579 RepID=A0A5C1AA80_9BACT|nr:hypothetical protein PX52LOC_01991 [Limnoglobus roseus]
MYSARIGYPSLGQRNDTFSLPALVVGLVGHLDLPDLHPHPAALAQANCPVAGATSVPVQWTEKWALPSLAEALGMLDFGSSPRSKSMTGVMNFFLLAPKSVWKDPTSNTVL